MTDIFDTHAPGLTTPAADAAGIIPNDSAGLPQVTRALYVGSGGAVRGELASGAEVTFAAMAPGMVYPLRLRKVFASGTTAGGLVGLW